MARNNNSGDLMVEVANAIRIKADISNPVKHQQINAQDFTREILEFKPRRIDLIPMGYSVQQDKYYQDRFTDGIVLADTIQEEWVDEADCTQKFYLNKDLLFFPLVPTNNLKKVTSMFSGCHFLEGVAALNLSNCTSVSGLFSDCRTLYLLPEVLDTSNVTHFASMFHKCYKIEKIPPLDISKSTDFYCTFYECWALSELPFPFIDMTIDKRMQQTFSGCKKLKKVIIKNSHLHNTNYYQCFYGCANLETITENNEEFQLLYPSSNLLQQTFSGCNKLTTPILVDCKNLTQLYGTFSGCWVLSKLTLLNTNKIKDWTSTFAGWKHDINLPITGLDMSAGTAFSSTFSECNNMVNLPFNHPIDLTYVTGFKQMFYNCNKLSKVIFKNSKLCKTSSYDRIFFNCMNLETITENNEPFYIMNGYESNVYDFYYIFYNCVKLITPIYMDLINIHQLWYTFYNCKKLKNITLLNAQNMYSWYQTFYSCLELENLIINGWKKGDIGLGTCPMITLDSIKNLITQSVDDGVERKLYLHKDVYNNWLLLPDIDNWNTLALNKKINIVSA